MVCHTKKETARHSCLKQATRPLLPDVLTSRYFMVMLVGGRTDRGVVKSPMNQDAKVMIEILDEILKHGQIGVVCLAATGSPIGSSSRGTIPNDRNTHEAHPAERDGLVGEKINDRLAFRNSHVERNKVSIGLHHLAPEKLLIFGRDVDEIAIGADGSHLGGWERLEIHRSLDGTTKSGREGVAACRHATTRSTGSAVIDVVAETSGKAASIGFIFVFESHRLEQSDKL